MKLEQGVDKLIGTQIYKYYIPSLLYSRRLYLTLYEPKYVGTLFPLSSIREDSSWPIR